MHRRRMMMTSIEEKSVTYAEGCYYLVSDRYGSYTDYNYWGRIALNGTAYVYTSDYPFYFIDNGNGTYYICYASGYSYRNGSSYTTGTSIGTKNGIAYKRENYTRTKGLSNTGSNTAFITDAPIEIWESD